MPLCLPTPKKTSPVQKFLITHVGCWHGSHEFESLQVHHFLQSLNLSISKLFGAFVHRMKKMEDFRGPAKIQRNVHKRGNLGVRRGSSLLVSARLSSCLHGPGTRH